MAENPHFVGVASAQVEGGFCVLRLAASDGKGYSLRLTDAAVAGVIQALQPLVPLERLAERDTLQVSRSQSLVRPDGRKAILLETQAGAIAFELPDDGIAILQRQLAALQSVQESPQQH